MKGKKTPARVAKFLDENLLDQFPRTVFEQWLDLVDTQLQGIPFEEKLVTETLEGILIQPLYTRKDELPSEKLVSTDNIPFTRGTSKPIKSIGQEFYCPGLQEFNQELQHDCSRGLHTIPLILDEAGCNGLDPVHASSSQIGKNGISITTIDDLETVLKHIDLSCHSFQINGGKQAKSFFGLFIPFLLNCSFDISTLEGSLSQDPLSRLATTGTLQNSIDFCYGEMGELVRWCNKNTPKFRILGIDTCIYAESGGNTVQELAFAMATGTSYLKALLDQGMNVDEIAPAMSFTFSAGSSFFMEVAKFRAARSFWAQIIQAFGGNGNSQNLTFYVRTALANQTRYDPYTNLLRNTTESLSAMIGGCNRISVSPFDRVSKTGDSFSRGISRNIPIILDEECHINQVTDPAGGSWFIESLTESLGKKAWELFQKVEKKGGMYSSLNHGWIQKDIEKMYQKRKARIQRRKQIIVGTNMYADPEGKPLNTETGKHRNMRSLRIQEVRNFCKNREFQLSQEIVWTKGKINFEKVILFAEQGATLEELSSIIKEPKYCELQTRKLRSRRFAEEYEKLRIKVKASPHVPLVFLATIGDVSQYRKRSDFVTDFLHAGGFSIINHSSFLTPQKAAKKAIESGARISVICSNNTNYPEIVPNFINSVKATRPEMYFIVVGYPKDQIENLRRDGVNEFIHSNSNQLQLLGQLQTQAGIIHE